MEQKLIALVASFAVIFYLLTLVPSAESSVVFSENFSSGGFPNWTETYVGSGSRQTISNGVARFIVPTPTGGNATYSYLKKDGFTSTPNSTVTVMQDIYATQIPKGYTAGNGAIFFLYICDTTDPTGNNGNFGVGIDGCGLWSIWIGGNPIYTYAVQTAGSPPSSGAWYHTVLSFNNTAGTVGLTINGTVVISAAQHEFTDKTHSLSLLSGMGEDWYGYGSGQQEVDVCNIALEISDASAPISTPTSTSNSAAAQQTESSPNQNHVSTPNPTTKTATPTPSITQKPSPAPIEPSVPSPSPSQTTGTSTVDFPFWVFLPLSAGIAIGVVVVVKLKKSMKDSAL